MSGPPTRRRPAAPPHTLGRQGSLGLGKERILRENRRLILLEEALDLVLHMLCITRRMLASMVIRPAATSPSERLR
jgi:hypothetical protein